MSRFRKVGSDGALLSDDATEWVAVLDTSTNLMWTVEEIEGDSIPWAAACEIPARLRTAGFNDWRMPTVEELFCLADRSTVNPAIDEKYFPDCEPCWYWSSTVAAYPGDPAWGVTFDEGMSSWASKDRPIGFVRAVRLASPK